MAQPGIFSCQVADTNGNPSRRRQLEQATFAKHLKHAISRGEPDLGFPPFTWMNQSLRCAVARFFGEVPAEYAAQVPGFVPGLGFDHGITAWISRLAAVGLLIATAVLAAMRRLSRQSLIAAVLCLSLLLSPISWKAHHVALIPAIFLLVMRGLEGRRWIWWFLGSYVVLCLLGEEITGKDLKQVQQSLYLVTAGTLAIWGLCLGEQRSGET